MNVIELKNISKFYPNVTALDKVDFSLKKGEIHALLGENGAGKSTLMKILYGMTENDRGDIFIKGKKVHMKNSLEAIDYGIGMVHQHFMLSDALSILENIIAGFEPVKGWRVDYKKARKDIKKLCQKFSFEIDLDTLVEDLSVGEKQMVEIMKVLYRGTDIIILDEPTAVLTPLEVDKLFCILRELKKEGKSIIIITHKLYEVTDIADSVTVLRDGLVTGHANPKEKTPNELANMMVGREINRNYNKNNPIGESRFRLEDISLKDGERNILHEINLDLKKGEILGIAGVEGNGQSELTHLLTGEVKGYSGSIYLDNKKISGNAKDFLDSQIGHIPEDRLAHGVVENMDIGENIILGYHNKEEFSTKYQMKYENIYKYADKKRKEYRIRSSSSENLISELSGGNQQKVVLSRVISQDPKVLICSQPTRGVDVGASEYIHNKLLDFCKKGNSILLLSADLEEIKALSDRIAVIYKGRIVSISKRGQLSDTELGILMTGGSLDKAKEDGYEK